MFVIVENEIGTLHSFPFLVDFNGSPVMCDSVQSVVELGGLDAREYAFPNYDPATQMIGDVIVGNPSTSKVLPRPSAEIDAQIAADLQTYVNSIDLAADRARQRLVSPGLLVDQEYLMAYEDALAYRDSGYTGDVPAGVSTWAGPKEWSPQQAADDIILQRGLWKAASDQIRGKRLAGKEAVRNAAPADRAAISQAWIAELDALFV